MRIHLPFALTLALFLALSGTGLGQSVAVTSSGSPDFHFKVNGSDYFPIGWFSYYSDPYSLDPSRGITGPNGANVIFMYWGHLLYGYGNPNAWNPSGYRDALVNYLNTIRNKGLMAIIDVGGVEKPDGTSDSWGPQAAYDIVYQFCDDPAVFGWYLADEPEGTATGTAQNPPSHYRGTGYPSPSDLAQIAAKIKDAENNRLGAVRHPVFPLVGCWDYYSRWNYDFDPNGNHYLPFDNVFCNALAGDSYNYTTWMDNNSHPEHDYNDVSRVATQRGLIKVRELQNTDNSKMGFIVAVMTHDLCTQFENRPMTAKEVKYESLSPIIQGARGLLYYTWDKVESSQSTLDNARAFIRFFHSNSLGKVVMAGTNCDNAVSLQNFKIDGQSSSRDNYTWRNYNNWHTVMYDASDPELFNFKEFNFIARKYQGSYYLFSVNDYRQTIQTDFVLDGMLASNETVYQIQELNVNGTVTQKNFDITNTEKRCRFTDTFGAYDAKVYRIDVIAWSPTYRMSGTSWEETGGGIALGDFDGNGVKDFIVMSVPSDVSGAKPFRYKIGWNIVLASDARASYLDMNSTNFPSTGRGELSGVAWTIAGAGIATFDLNKNGKPEVFFTAVPEETYIDQFRTKVGWDLQGSPYGSVWFADYSYHNFPPLGRAEVSGMSSAITEADVAVADIQNNGVPKAFLMSIDNGPYQNDFRYKVSDISIPSSPTGVMSFSSPSNYYTAGAIGWETSGAGMAVADIDGDSQMEAIVCGVEKPSNTVRYIIWNINSSGSPEGTWRPNSNLSMQTSYPLGSVGVSCSDLDGDGDMDIAVMAIEKNPQLDNYLIRFGTNRRSGNLNYPNPFQSRAGSDAKSAGPPVPADYTLMQNYPNPFNPSTLIRYGIPRDGYVTLKVYDMLGREVKTLASGHKPAGYYEAVFDGSELSSGIYFCRLVTDDHMSSLKMLLMK